MSPQNWGHPDGQLSDQKPGWHPRFGDRIQQLVFIGQQMKEATIRARLDACLLDECLANASIEAWAQLSNPFPELEESEPMSSHNHVHGIDFAETKYALPSST